MSKYVQVSCLNMYVIIKVTRETFESHFEEKTEILQVVERRLSI